MVTDHLLINESKLGIKLNQCVHEKRRSDFSLMLAMLTEDAREFSEFTSPHIAQAYPGTGDLRKQFQLPEQQALALNNIDEISRYNEAQYLQDNKLQTIHLLDALVPKPLAFKNDNTHIANNILGNMNVHSQERYFINKAAKTSHTTQRANFNASLWLKNIENSISANEIKLANVKEVHSIA